MSKNKKVNLNEIQSKLAKRGKPAYTNKDLAQDILSLNPEVEGDAFIWADAQVNPTLSEKEMQTVKARFRNRAESVAESLGIAIRINFTTDGEMIISLRNQ